jgi:hypothetical protein
VFSRATKSGTRTILGRITLGVILALPLPFGVSVRGAEQPETGTPLAETSNGQKSGPKIGRIIIIGNCTVPESIILDQVAEAHFASGALLFRADSCKAERNLIRLDLFRNDDKVRPTVKVLDHDSDSEFKDILVIVEEKPSTQILMAIIDGISFGRAWLQNFQAVKPSPL